VKWETKKLRKDAGKEGRKRGKKSFNSSHPIEKEKTSEIG
jgi:hypothetical protein